MQKKIFVAVSYVLLGMVIGYLGSFMLYMEWIGDFVMGWCFAMAMHKVHSAGKLILYDAWYLAAWISTGIFLGGLPMWIALSGVQIEKGFSSLISFQIFGAASSFFAGTVSNEIREYFRNRSESRIG